MPEATVNQLEQKRFVINPESVEAMKRARSAFAGLQQDYPYLSGLSFFGSRTKGREKIESDMDMCIFYDSSRITDLHLGPTRDLFYFKKIKQTLYESVGIPLDEAKSVIGISKENTQKNIKSFVKVAKPLINRSVDTDTLVDKVDIGFTQNIIFRFFLAVGDDVYISRHYVLDRFEQMPEGEQYFQILMRYLAWFERYDNPRKYFVPQFSGYPKTIEEARKYFLTKPD
ncbi:MAG: hypothetical protein HY426_02655 [Candidatus Levybacteria bacterium]|nr:hypothetical protein [Candidatus Levybacteria bacterium]